MMNVLFISVHPDDETLGCGGTILKHGSAGDQLYWLILTDAYASLGFDEHFLAKRKRQVVEVAEAYGFKQTFKLGFPTTQLHNVDFSKLITEISNVIREVKPEIVYTVNRTDIHTDHQVAAKAVFSCTKSFRYPYIKKVLMYECISETEMVPQLPEHIFMPNVFCDITDFIERKIEIMQIFESEVQEPPLPRSLDNIRALARYRGAIAGVHYAEAFMLIRELL